MKQDSDQRGLPGLLPLLLLLAALGMLAYGAASGEAEVIFVKAANICMECIGLG